MSWTSSKALMLAATYLAKACVFASNTAYKYFVEPVYKSYYHIVEDHITSIVEYDLNKVQRNVIFQINCGHVAAHVVSKYLSMEFLKPWLAELQMKTSPSPCSKECVYMVTCCKGHTVFVHGSKELSLDAIKKALERRGKPQYLYMGIEKMDLLDLFEGPRILSQDLALTPHEMMVLAYLAGKVSASTLLKNVLHAKRPFPTVLTIDRLTLDETLYKDSEVVKL